MNIGERVHTFGDKGALTGIVTLPLGEQGGVADHVAERPFVVILNAGLVHRVGPFRMSVDLARRLARKGVGVFRFDQPGIGDSVAPSSAQPVDEQAVAGIRAAMDFLDENYSARSFTVGGLCTGALNAHRVGVLDERVEGIWLLDGYVYSTWASRGLRVAKALTEPRAWGSIGRRVVLAGADRLLSHLGDPPKAESVDASPSSQDPRVNLFFQEWPPIDSVRADLEKMLRRGVRFLFAYTGGWSGFTHTGHFEEMFPGLLANGGIQVSFQPHADHTYFSMDEREAMFRVVERFVVEGMGRQ